METPGTATTGWRARFAAATDLGGASRVALLTLFGLNLADEFDRLAFSTLTPEIRDALHLSDSQIVMVGSIAAVFVLFSAVPLGVLADRMERLKLAKVATVIWVLMAILTGLAWTLPVLFAARFFSGVAKTSNDVVHTGLLADYYAPAVHPKVFQIHRLANALSAPASLLVGVIAAVFGWRWAFILLAFPTLLLVGRLSRLREPYRGESIDADAARAAHAAAVQAPRFRQVCRQLCAIPTLRRMWAGFMVIGVAGLALAQMLSLFFEKVYGFGPLGRGFVQFMFGVGMVIGIVIGGQIGARFSRQNDFAGVIRVLAWGFAAFAAGIALMGLAPWAGLSLASAPLASAGIGIVIPILPTLMVRVMPPRIRSQGYSFSSVAVAVGALFGIPIATIGETIGYRPAFVILSGIVIASAVILASTTRLIDADIARADEALRSIGGVH